MGVFDKSLGTGVDPKQAKLILVLVSIVVIGLLSVNYIVKPILDTSKVNKEIEAKQKELDQAKVRYQNAVAEYDRKLRIFQQQKENYDREKARFENSSLADDTDLKYMIADIAENLDIKIIQIGGMIANEENEEYIKKSIPYKVEGDINKLSQLIFFLENSNYLVSFSDSDLDISVTNNNDVSVNMHIGAYFTRKN